MKTAGLSSANAWRARLIAILLWSLMAAGFGGVGWVFGVRPIVVMVQNWRLAQDYREVEAKIVGSSVPLPNGGTHSVIAAQYEFDGKTFHTSRLTLVDDAARDEPENSSLASSLRSLVNTDAKTTIWVNPNDPAQAVVSRFFTEQAILRRVSLAAAFTLLSLVGIAGMVGALGKFGYYHRFDRQKKSWIIVAVIAAAVYPLRRFLVDPDVNSDYEFFEFIMFLEFGAGLIILVAIKMLFERDRGNQKKEGDESDAGASRPVRVRRKKK